MKTSGFKLACALQLLTFSVPGCFDGNWEDQSPTLPQVSDQLTFDSVTRLGAHRLEATCIRRFEAPDGTYTEVQHDTEILWQGWDDFRLRRTVDASLVTDVVVVDGTTWALSSGDRYGKQRDTEPYRMELRRSWNVWHDALEPFLDNVLLSEAGKGIIEGRRARRYRVSLLPQDAGEARQPRLVSLDGDLWLDEASAVRLLAEVNGTWRPWGREDELRHVSLKLRRTRFGEPQGIRVPSRKRKGAARNR